MGRKSLKKDFLPPAQDPEEVPPLLLHSALVKQVPFL